MNSESCYVAGMSALMTVLCVLLMYLASMAFARAQDHTGHPPQDQALHDKFYSGWYFPDDPSKSCCNKQDCYPTEIKYVGGKIYARRREDGEWLLIPPQKIERNRDNPDGRNHICSPRPDHSRAGEVYCFALGGGI